MSETAFIALAALAIVGLGVGLISWAVRIGRLGERALRIPIANEALVLRLLYEHVELRGLELVKRSRGQLQRGTAYVTLGLMEDAGLVTSTEENATLYNIGIPRRIYRLTHAGLEAVARKGCRK